MWRIETNVETRGRERENTTAHSDLPAAKECKKTGPKRKYIDSQSDTPVLKERKQPGPKPKNIPRELQSSIPSMTPNDSEVIFRDLCPPSEAVVLAADERAAEAKLQAAEAKAELETLQTQPGAQ